MSDATQKTDYQTQQSPKGRGLLRPTGRALIGHPVLMLDLVLAGGVYQGIAGVFILVLALADEVYRVVARRTWSRVWVAGCEVRLLAKVE